MAENKWVIGVITLLMGVITPSTTGRGPPCSWGDSQIPQQQKMLARAFFVVQCLSDPEEEHW